MSDRETVNVNGLQIEVVRSITGEVTCWAPDQRRQCYLFGNGCPSWNSEGELPCPILAALKAEGRA